MHQEEQQVGSYHLHKHLEHGTIADAYLATHIPTDKPVIIKIFQATLSEAHVAQCTAYIRACTLLEHPAILRPLDFGEESGSLFLVIDAPGETLRQRHPQGLSLPLDTIAFYVNQIANALHFAHNQHMLHLNLRPEQLFVGPNDNILLDYTSRLLYSSLPTFIPEGALSPPQEPPAPATDQYALAMIIYEWLGVTRPFIDTTTNEQHIRPMPGEQVSTIRPYVEQVLSRALALDPAQRYEHVLAFADAFILALNVGPEATKRRQKLLSSNRTTSFGMGSLQIAKAGNWHNPFSSGFSYNPHHICTLAFSPDNKYLAFNSSEPAIYIAEVTEQGTLFTYQGHTDTVSALAWSPDGQAIASMSATVIQIWEVATGKLLSTHQVSPSSRELQWSPDGKFLATTGWNSPIQLWQVFTDNTPLTYNGHSNSVSSIAWSPDSTRIASASKGEIQVWEVATGMLICTYRGHFGEINAAAWSSDGTMIASGGNDMTLHIWNAATRAPLFLHRFSSSTITAIGWSPDKDYIITGTRDGIIGAYAVKDGENAFSYHSPMMHNAHMGKVAWSPDLNILAVGGEDRRVEIANRTDGKVLLCRAPAAFIEKIGQASVSQDELMTTTSTTSFSSEQTTTTTITTTTTPPSGPPVVHTTTRQRRAVKMWGGKDNRDTIIYYGHKSAVVPLAWSPDSSRLASGGYDGSMHVWDAATSITIFIYRGHLDPVVAVAWSPDGTRLASGSLDNTVKIWNPLTGQEILTYHGHQNFVQTLSWSPDSTRIASGSEDNTVQVWDASSGKTILTYNEHTAGINSVDWSSDGQRLASGSADQTVHIWEAATGNTVFVYRNHVAAVLAIAWSPDGTRIASCGAYRWRRYEESLHASAHEAKLHIWTVPTDQAAIIYGQVEHPDMSPYDTISVAWSSDGQMLATHGRPDVQIYDTSTGEAMAAIMNHLRSNQPESLLHIAWSPDGTRIAGSYSNSQVHVWPAQAQSS